VRAVLSRLQSSKGVVARLRRRNVDPKTYFKRLLELARKVAAQSGDLTGLSPRTVAAGSVYVASLAVSAKTFTQREAGETLGMAEYTIREFCGRTRNKRRNGGTTHANTRAGAKDVIRMCHGSTFE
jgi:transcription initiation factor TFIIIB Brf1 subunit/transcription initiation factor TFIIB